MPRYYCDYCDTYLTHDSPSVRKQHNAGYKHKANVRMYYQQFEEQQTQSLIDQRIKEHLGQTAAYQQLGTGGYNPRMIAPLPRQPILPTPAMPAIRTPPVLPRPPVPGYVQPMGVPLGAPSQLPGQVNVVPRPPPPPPVGIAPINIPGSTAAPPPSSVTPSMMSHATYQVNQALPASGGSDSLNLNISASAPEANH